MCIVVKNCIEKNGTRQNSQCVFCNFTVCYLASYRIFSATSSATCSGVVTVVVLLSEERGRIRKLTINCHQSGQKEVWWNNIGAAVMSTCHVTKRRKKGRATLVQRETQTADWWIWGIHLCQLLCHWACGHVKGLLPSNHLRFEFPMRSRACRCVKGQALACNSPASCNALPFTVTLRLQLKLIPRRWKTFVLKAVVGHSTPEAVGEVWAGYWLTQICSLHRETWAEPNGIKGIRVLQGFHGKCVCSRVDN